MKAIAVILLPLQLLCVSGCIVSEDDKVAVTAAVSRDQIEQIKIFCGDCHQMPSPANFSKSQWPAEVYRGFRFYIESGRSDLNPPEQNLVIRYFQDQAPDELASPVPIEPINNSNQRFVTSKLAIPVISGFAVSSLSQHQWNHRNHVLFCDMLSGIVRAWDLRAGEYQELANIPNPAGMEWCDLNHDGLPDLVVADLGSFQPVDHDHGAVYWLKGRSDGTFETQIIAAQLGRVADVAVADFNGDGRSDVVVAEFGWQKTGRILLLEQVEQSSTEPAFRLTVLDTRHGTINVCTVDPDEDGDHDFIALISQEHEAVETFVNDGAGAFHKRPVCDPADPAFGSSGMTPVDLDEDGDLDLVVTNGDMLDSFVVKPYHSLRWLENLGGNEFESHQLALIPGAHAASVGDLDRDGDLDIVTAAFFPVQLVAEMPADERKRIASAVWLEQTATREFTMHVLEYGDPAHACHLLMDIDADGDDDVILGNFRGSHRASSPPLTIFENTTQ